MKRKAIGIIVVLALCMATTVFAVKVRGQQKASTPPPMEAIEHFMENPVYTGEEIVFEKDGVYSQSYPELYPISLNTNYVYWINDDGFIRFITEK